MIQSPKNEEAKASRPLHIDNGTLEALKWLALVLMTGDHVNKYVFAETLPGLFELGRIAMPLFLLVLAYNLARADAFQAGVHQRMGIRLAAFGALATLPYIAVTGVLGGWWPLNMLFTMLLLTLICWLIDHSTAVHSLLAVVVFSLGGSLVEYWWPGLLLGLACWGYCKRASRFRLTLVMVATAALWPVITTTGRWSSCPCSSLPPEFTSHGHDTSACFTCTTLPTSQLYGPSSVFQPITLRETAKHALSHRPRRIHVVDRTRMSGDDRLAHEPH